MMRILIFLIIGRVVVKGASSIYQAEEDDNIIFSVDGDIQTELSLTNIICLFQSEKILYHMIRGSEDSESQDEQFAGRVQCDRDALRGGRVKLHLFRVTAEDSGNYRCDLSGYNDNSLTRWARQTSEHFVLRVTQRAKGDCSINAPDQTKTGAKYQPNHQQAFCPYPSKVGPFLALAALILLILFPLAPINFRLFRFVHRRLWDQAEQ